MLHAHACSMHANNVSWHVFITIQDAFSALSSLSLAHMSGGYSSLSDDSHPAYSPLSLFDDASEKTNTSTAVWKKI